MFEWCEPFNLISLDVLHIIVTDARDYYDVVSRPTLNNILTLPGYMVALRQTLRLVAGGLLWGGVPCSSFVFLSSGTTGRKKDNPMGWDTPSVRMGNLTALRFMLLVAVAMCRGSFWAIEQPGSSVLPYVPSIKAFLDMKDVQHFFQRLSGPHWLAHDRCMHVVAVDASVCSKALICLKTLISSTLSPMGAYGHFSLKPTMVFGSAPVPQTICQY